MTIYDTFNHLMTREKFFQHFHFASKLLMLLDFNDHFPIMAYLWLFFIFTTNLLTSNKSQNSYFRHILLFAIDYLHSSM